MAYSYCCWFLFFHHHYRGTTTRAHQPQRDQQQPQLRPQPPQQWQEQSISPPPFIGSTITRLWPNVRRRLCVVRGESFISGWLFTPLWTHFSIVPLSLYRRDRRDRRPNTTNSGGEKSKKEYCFDSVVSITTITTTDTTNMTKKGTPNCPWPAGSKAKRKRHGKHIFRSQGRGITSRGGSGGSGGGC